MKFLCVFLAMALAACGGPQSKAANPQEPAATKPAGPPKMGAVGSFTLVNDARSPVAERTVSFGQIFRPGEVRPGNAVSVQVGGHDIPTQMDAKALNPDGSVRHAVMTIALPELQAGQVLKATLTNRPGKPATAQGAYVPVPKLDVVVTLKPKGGAPQILRASLPAIAQDPKAAAPGFWLKGPLAEERRYTANLNDDLQVVFDVFTPTAGPARVDVSFHNDWANGQREPTLNYDVELQLNGASVYRAQAVHHYYFSTWHHLLWTDGSPDIRVVPNLDDLKAAAAIPRYDTTFAIDSRIRAEIEKAGDAPARPPLNPAMITTSMPNTGGRMDIGPLPAWAAVDLLAGDASTRRALLANADAAGAIPWHLRDRKTGRPLSIDDHPDLWLDSRGEDGLKGILPRPFEQENDDWHIDGAHQPSLVYLPYLLTGRQYYRDELVQQAAYNLLSYDSKYRGGSQGLVIGANGEAWQQVRAMAWFIRTMANAAYILPSNDPMQPYFDSKLRGNLAKFVEVLIKDRRMKAAGEVEGWVPGDITDENQIRPWMQGFLAVVLTWTNDMGYPDAGRTVGWMSNFLAGLYTSGDKGFDPARGVAYSLPIREGDEDSRLLNTWAEVYKKSDLPSLEPSEMQQTFGDYALIMRAAVGGAYAVTGSAKSAQAYRYLSANLGRIKNDYERGDPTFAIIPASPPPPAR